MDNKVKEFLGNDTPWPVTSILEVLVASTETLLDEYSYDSHDHERVRCAVGEAKKRIVIGVQFL